MKLRTAVLALTFTLAFVPGVAGIGGAQTYGSGGASPSSGSAAAERAAAAAKESPLQVPAMGPIPLTAQPIGPQTPPEITVRPPERRRLEHPTFGYDILLHQWSPTEEVPPESVISERYIQTRDETARSLTLKEAIYLALRNNPAIQAAQLTPLDSLQAVRETEATFDPDLNSKIDEMKNVAPTTSILQTGGSSAFTTKQYDWDFGVNKLLATTNGTVGITFDNSRGASNSLFAAINPSYSPFLELSLSQPLLRSFGFRFATINVRIAEANQKASQFTYEQQLSDFILKVSDDYWNVVRAEENLEVAREAYKLAADLVRQNEISVRVGVLAPLDLQEAQSEQATNAANVYQADNTLAVARAALRQDVMLNPSRTFLPQQIEPSDKPTGAENIAANEEQSLELAMEYRPELASMRQMIRGLLLQVKFAENQTLPQLNLGAQFGLSATAGTTKCTTVFPGFPTNCTTLSGSHGNKLPFGGIYGDTLNDMWSFGFYNYAVALSFERPLTNDAAKAALTQAKVEYEQQRLQYRSLISQIVVDVQNQLSNVATGIKRVAATRVASNYARESLRAEQERYRVGMANTHELLQFQEELVAALGNQVNAEVDLEIAKASLLHAEGTLLQDFNINFVPENPHQTRWYGML
jgi:outer membrane protein